jgi:hypothetical protein
VLRSNSAPPASHSSVGLANFHHDVVRAAVQVVNEDHHAALRVLRALVGRLRQHGANVVAKLVAGLIIQVEPGPQLIHQAVHAGETGLRP